MERAWFKHRIIAIYTLVSVIIFDRVYETSKEVIDELFHIEQGLNYCHGMFQEWNPKITTLPGLYLLTVFIPRCTPYFLRLIPLICSIVNFYLIFGIKSMVTRQEVDRGRLGVLLDSTAIAILPPMYFFAHLYYTDIPSITMILFTIYFSLKERFFISSMFGFLSVIMRQTNIVWTAGLLGAHLVDLMISKSYKRLKLEETTFSQLLFALKSHLMSPKMLLDFIVTALKSFYGYILVIFAFIAFLYVNGSIVVGDKSAHEAKLHIPQIFYFSLFTLTFGSSLWIPKIVDGLKSILSWKGIIGFIILSALMVVVIYYNTIVHPYLLADNRHYTFYVWNRFYRKHMLVRYLLIPVYIFGLFVICNSLNGSIGSKIFFVISTVLTICLQSLLEVRYFLIPFLILRLTSRHVSRKWSLLEILINLVINYVTFTIFFTREIKWEDFDEPQRLIW